jgi:hypothetical protein
MSDKPTEKQWWNTWRPESDYPQAAEPEFVCATKKKPGFWSTLGRKIGEAIGQAKFGS